MIIEIDEGSGFCFGVTTAIEKAEEMLKNGQQLSCLGDIVHNGMECERLRKMGLKTIDQQEFQELHDKAVLLRAHGEPPSTYDSAKQNNITIVDATCPVVLALQKRIKKRYEELKNQNEDQGGGTTNENDNENQNCEQARAESKSLLNYAKREQFGRNQNKNKADIVIFGKNGHAEVLGLVGQTEGEAIVIEHYDDVQKLDFTHDIYLYSQTTKSLEEFHRIIDYCQAHMAPGATFQSFDTICRQVANRMPNICQFATKHDLILFVSGRKSSNGKVLYSACKEKNHNTYLIEGPEEINSEWLNGITSVGICGATSTPKWLMEQCKEKIEKYEKDNNSN